MAAINVNDLPQPILFDILSRVPAIWLSQCRFVCKLWLEIIDDQRFRNVNLARSGEKTLFYFDSDCKFHLVKLEDEEVKLTEVTELNQVRWSQFRGTCNGLLFFVKYLQLGTVFSRQIFVFNPVTKESLVLPERPPEEEEHPLIYTYMVNYGFGFDSSTNTYKMVRIIHQLHYKSLVRAQVYDLKNRVWRACKFPPPFPGTGRFVFASGAVNWFFCSTGDPRSRWEDSVLSFDLSKEVFRSIRVPIGVDLGNSCTRPMMLELGGSLALVDYSGRGVPRSPIVVVYVLKDLESHEWTPKYRIRSSVRFYDVIGLYDDDKQLLLYNNKSSDLFLSNCNGKRWPRRCHCQKNFQPLFDQLFYVTPSFSSLKTD